MTSSKLLTVSLIARHNGGGKSRGACPDYHHVGSPVKMNFGRAWFCALLAGQAWRCRRRGQRSFSESLFDSQRDVSSAYSPRFSPTASRRSVRSMRSRRMRQRPPPNHALRWQHLHRQRPERAVDRREEESSQDQERDRRPRVGRGRNPQHGNGVSQQPGALETRASCKRAV
jgi:hypothetical protein